MSFPATPVVNAPNLYLQDCFLTWLSTTEISISAGQARNSSNVNDIFVSTACTVFTTVSGAGGLDTGTIAASTLYDVYVIGSSLNNTLYAGLLSLYSATPNIVLPNGYDMYRRVGTVLTDGASHILKFVQSSGNNLTRTMWYDAPIQVLNAGTQAVAFAAVDLSASVPAAPIPTNVYMQAVFYPNAASDTACITPHGATNTSGYALITGQVTHVNISPLITVPCDSAAKVQYLLSTASATLTLNLVAYDDAL
jgi:hypothetical protein